MSRAREGRVGGWARLQIGNGGRSSRRPFQLALASTLITLRKAVPPPEGHLQAAPAQHRMRKPSSAAVRRPSGSGTAAAVPLIVAALIAAAAPAGGGSAAKPYASLPQHAQIAARWTVVEREPAGPVVEFAVAVRERNQAAIRRIALAVSDPRNSAYGQHLTAAEVKALTAPASADSAAVGRWIQSVSGCATITARTTDRLLWVRCTIAAASRLLSTSFRRLVNLDTQQQAVLAGRYTLPEPIKAAVAAIFGLHSLPLPLKRRRASQLVWNAQPVVNVTPAVIAEAYGVSGVTVNRQSRKNRQAVVEFQGATANVSDLQAFFDQYVPEAQSGDATIRAFVGDPGAGSADAEASLDIQYLMAMTPGISTDFYMYRDLDLCTGLKRWASELIEDPEPPFVHSISYGIQTNLSSAAGTPAGPDFGCTTASMKVIDDDLAKLAARGLSIIVASGDAGSAYSLDEYCSGVSETCMRKGISLTGTEVPRPDVAIRSAADCCSASFERNVPAFTFTESKHPTPQPRCSGGGSAAREVIVGVAHWGVPPRQFIGLTHTEEQCCLAAAEHGVGYTFLTGTTPLYPQIQASFPCLELGSGCCIVFDAIAHAVSNASAANGSSGTNALKAAGTCQLFSKVSDLAPRTGEGATSGGTMFAGTPELFPSWPASSPWVTAVGATRFSNASVGGRQVASRQFGSGGGFSAFIPRDPVAAFQASAVDGYLDVINGAWPFPPAAAISSAGRATPDVSAIGEALVVVQSGVAGLLSGTSASTPVFAGLISLLNEVRLAQPSGRPMGFLNPWMYEHKQMFRDVVVGTNALSGFAEQGGSAAPMAFGWNATRGWDPVTGLGAPCFQKMLAAAVVTTDGHIGVSQPPPMKLDDSDARLASARIGPRG